MNDDTRIHWDAWQVEEPGGDFVEQVMHAVGSGHIGEARRRRWMGPSLLIAATFAVASAAALAHTRLQAPVSALPRGAANPPPNQPSISVSAAAPKQAASGPVEHAPSTVIDRRRGDELRTRLSSQWSTEVERDPHTGLTLPRGSMGSSHNLGKDYIAARMREDFFPLARSCYEGALTRLPSLRGRVVIDFMIVGDAKVGGVVDQARIAETSDLTDPEFVTCIRESMLSMVFEPPENDGWVSVEYPILFAPDDGNDTARQR